MYSLNPTLKTDITTTNAAYAFRLFALLVLSLQIPTSVLAQDEAPPALEIKDGLSVAAAALIWSTPSTLKWHTDLPTCAPCNPSGVPFFDRWAIHQPQRLPARASDATLIGLALVSWVDLAGMGPNGAAATVGSIESILWTFAVTEFAKGALGRKRPVLYTEVAPEVATAVKNQRSMPSGHTSMAFALATSYWLARRNLADRDKPWMRWAMMAGAAGVGVLRVAAGKHHPSDVLMGAGVGIGTAILFHEFKF